MKIVTLVLGLCIMAGCKDAGDDASLLSKGVSRELADYRKRQLSDVDYTLSFDIPDKRSEPIVARERITCRINDLTKPLYLDFKQSKPLPIVVTVNGDKVAVREAEEHLIIPPRRLRIGKNVIHIAFTAGELSLNRNDDYLYTLLVPDRARTLFPCFDQPDIKARFALTLKAPKRWKALAAKPKLSQKTEGEFTTHQFGATKSISTYLFSFVAGDFKRAASKNEAIPMEILYRETDKKKAQQNIMPIFDLHRKSVDFMETYSAHPLPFEKLDMAAIPGFQYGGMEHPGAIQYRESTLFTDKGATPAECMQRAKLIAHETAHMWFGNLVTMKWFDDVWLKEVFANFMASKIINPAFPDIDHRLLFALAHYPSAYAIDRSRGAHPIKQRLDNLNHAGSLYGGVIYHKAPLMMRQLEAVMGTEMFRQGIVEYIHTYAYDNADWDDLINILDRKTDIDLKKWSNVWVYSSGRPVFSEEMDYLNGKISSLTIRQQAEDGSAKRWEQVFDIALYYRHAPTKVLPIRVRGKTTEVDAAKGLPKPDFISYNSNAMGYGVFPVSRQNPEYIAHITDKVSRAYSYLNLYENTLKGNIAPTQCFEILRQAACTEQDQLILKRICEQLLQLVNYFLPDTQRDSYRNELAAEVLEKMTTAMAPALKKTFFGLFIKIAYSKENAEQLYRIWNGALSIPNLDLDEDDYTHMAMELSIYQHPDAEAALQKTMETIKNPDKIKKLEFLLPALANDKERRKAFFMSLKHAKNREKENWTLEACRYIHHPLRQKEAISYVHLSLVWLEDIWKTGDIFFPKSWLDSSIGMYASEQARNIVERFLRANPNMNLHLKRKIQQASDKLYKAHQLRTHR